MVCSAIIQAGFGILLFINNEIRRITMTKFKTYMFSALALGTMASGFIATEALADHKPGRGRGYGRQVVDVYVDARHDPRLEKVIGDALGRTNPYVNIVTSPYYADVTVTVDGYLSRPDIYGRAGRRYRSGYATMDYDYKIRVTAGGRTLYRDRAYGEVSRPLSRRYGYYNNSGGKIEKAELAIGILGVFLEAVTGDGYIYATGRGGGGYANIERALRLEVYQQVAQYVAHIEIPRRYGNRDKHSYH
jgi:hypothetical protein